MASTEPIADRDAERDVERDEDCPARSGEHRIQQGAVADGQLPPTPQVLVKRPRIVTGAYAVIRPAKGIPPEK